MARLKNDRMSGFASSSPRDSRIEHHLTVRKKSKSFTFSRVWNKDRIRVAAFKIGFAIVVNVVMESSCVPR